MSDEPDKESKNEEPTEKKITGAREKGNVPISRELATFGGLFGIFIFFLLASKERLLSLIETLYVQHDTAGRNHINIIIDVFNVMIGATNVIIFLLGPTVTLIAGPSIIAALSQNSPQIVFDRITPKFERISPKSGWQRLFGRQGGSDFVKTTFKFSAFGTILALCIRSLPTTNEVIFGDPNDLIGYILSVILSVVVIMVTTYSFIAMADLFWTRRNWRYKLRMTTKELKDEVKESEGDPFFRSFRKSLSIRRSKNRMMLSVPKCNLIVTNPTHYAVAIRYVRGEDAAPLVLAKGQNKIALRIREIAENSGVPIIENKLLARSLFRSVEIDQLIPPEFYKAIAEIILMLQRTRGYNEVAQTRMSDDWRGPPMETA